jgi:DNA-binding MarR family transcriptional regulator
MQHINAARTEADAIDAVDVREDLTRAIALDAFAPYLLNQITNRLNARMQHHLRPHRVSVPQWRVLCLLSLHGPQSIGALVASTVIPQSTLSRVIDQLERRELATRRPRPQNNRVVEVHLTGRGRALFRRILPAALRVGDELMAGLPNSEGRRFIHNLRRLLQQLHQDGSAQT